MIGRAGLIIKCEIEEVWMVLENPDMTMEDAQKRLEEMGNKVIEVDHEGRRFKVEHCK